jgi:transcriptional regulator with PAS, ATPase and Fis domain
MPFGDRGDVSRLLTAIQILGRDGPRDTPALPQATLDLRSSPMRDALALATRIARSDATVLITGESGVGKERIARCLHRASLRSFAPFIAVNCGAFTETLLDSELYGHVRGAFTGADQDRRGVFEEAHGGTLLLDEMGDVSATMQLKLLRVLQEREIRRVGETRPRPVDVRVIAATHRDLVQEVADGRFREDLYYRLQVIDLHIPPLRERPEDLRILAQTLLAETVTRLRRPPLTYAPAALECILRYTWPGNIRQLAHAIERACTMTAGPHIEVGDLPPAVTDGSTSADLAPEARPLRVLEREHVLAVLARHHGDRRGAAAELRISMSTLKRRLRQGRRPPPPRR